MRKRGKERGILREKECEKKRGISQWEIEYGVGLFRVWGVEYGIEYVRPYIYWETYILCLVRDLHTLSLTTLSLTRALHTLSLTIPRFFLRNRVCKALHTLLSPYILYLSLRIVYVRPYILCYILDSSYSKEPYVFSVRDRVCNLSVRVRVCKAF